MAMHTTFSYAHCTVVLQEMCFFNSTQLVFRVLYGMLKLELMSLLVLAADIEFGTFKDLQFLQMRSLLLDKNVHFGNEWTQLGKFHTCR